MVWNPFKIFSKKNKEATKEQAIIDKKTQTEIKNVTRKSTELLKIAEIIGIEHESGKHSKTSIDALKEQINAVQTTGRKLSSSLKESTDLLVNITPRQKTLRKEVKKLEKENQDLDESERKGEGEKKYIDRRRKGNDDRIAIGENEINSIEEKVKELRGNIAKNLAEFKREVSELEIKVKNLEYREPKRNSQTSEPILKEYRSLGFDTQVSTKNTAGTNQENIMDQEIPEGLKLQAPLIPVTPKPVRPALKTVRHAPPPPGTIADKLGKALKEFKAQKNLRSLVKYIESDGVYEGSKEYLLKELDFLKKDLGVISDNELPKMQEKLKNFNLTKEEFLQITNTLISRIDINLKSKSDKLAEPTARKQQSFVEKEEKRKEKGEERVTRL